jgi:isoleucyl-tRNA synthetase
MDLVRDLISIGRNAREEAKVKVRQPISEVLIDGKNEEIISDLVSLIEEELNVKEVTFINNVNEYMNFMVKPNFKIAGPVFGQNIKYFSEALLNLPVEQINELQTGNNISVNVQNEEFEISSDMVDIRISAKEGFDVAMENNNFIILNTNLTKELIEEGIARELISKIQNMRKTKDYNIVDRITIYYKGDEEVVQTINNQRDFIMKETLAINIIEKDGLVESFDLNGHDTYLDTEKEITN